MGPMGIIYWVLLILCIIAYFTGHTVAGVATSTGVVLILLFLLGYKAFGTPMQ